MGARSTCLVSGPYTAISTEHIQDPELSPEGNMSKCVLLLLSPGVHSQMDDKKFKQVHKNYKAERAHRPLNYSNLPSHEPTSVSQVSESSL